MWKAIKNNPVKALLGGGCLGLVLVLGGLVGGSYYYIFYGSRFDYKPRKLEPNRSIILSKPEKSRPFRSGITTNSNHFSLRLQGIQADAENNNFTLEVRVPGAKEFDFSGQFLKKLIKLQNTKIISKNFSPQIREVSPWFPSGYKDSLSTSITVQFDGATLLQNLKGLRGSLVYHRPETIEEYSLPAEDQKSKVQAENQEFKLEVEGKNVYFPDLNSLGEFFYMNAYDSAGEALRSVHGSPLPQTYSEARSFVEKAITLFSDGQRNLKFNRSPESLKFYQLKESQKETSKFQLEFQIFKRSVEDFEREHSFSFANSRVTMQPLEPYTSPLANSDSAVSLNNEIDTYLRKWKGIAKGSVARQVAGHFYDTAGERLEPRGRGSSGTGQNQIEFYFTLPRRPERAELYFLAPKNPDE